MFDFVDVFLELVEYLLLERLRVRQLEVISFVENPKEHSRDLYFLSELLLLVSCQRNYLAVSIPIGDAGVYVLAATIVVVVCRYCIFCLIFFIYFDNSLVFEELVDEDSA